MKNTKHVITAAKPLGETLSKTRLALGLTQQQLQDMTGVCVTTIKDYEKNQTGMKLSVLEQLAEPLGLELTVQLKRKSHEG
jgi:transcriptional regulator with XRE-family HTH domain